jgi:hypothetical protein
VSQRPKVGGDLTTPLVGHQVDEPLRVFRPHHLAERYVTFYGIGVLGAEAGRDVDGGRLGLTFHSCESDVLL